MYLWCIYTHIYTHICILCNNIQWKRGYELERKREYGRTWRVERNGKWCNYITVSKIKESIYMMTDVGMDVHGWITMHINIVLPQNAEIDLPHDPAMPLLGTYQKYSPHYTYRYMLIHVHWCFIHNGKNENSVHIYQLMNK